MSFSLTGLEADRAQELLAHFAAIVDSSDDAILSKDLNGIIRSWNTAAQKIFGYTAEEIIGKPVTLLIPEGHLDEEPNILKRIKSGERIDHYETVRKRKDGSLVNISLTVSPIKDAKGVIIGASKIARDITMQKEAEELSFLYSAIVQSSDDAIISKDLNGIIRSWNKGAEAIFGYEAWEMIGKPITTLIPAGYINEEPEILGRIRRGEKVDHYQTKRQRKDGTLVSLSLTVSPIKNRAGTVIGASKIARDITRQKASEQALKEAKDELAALNRDLEDRVRERTQALQKAVSQMEEFSYSVSHDLRSPVRAMQAYAQAALEDYGDRLDDVGRDYLHRIVRNSVRMDKLIIDVLIYSRLARSDVKTQPIAIAPLLHDIIQLYPEMQPPRAEIVLQEPLGRVMADDSSLSQALSNLISNAVKFVPPQTLPKVTIRAEPRGQNVRLWVTDNGIGIKPEYQSRLFGMFERLKTESTYEGTGIGLAIVRKAAEKMGGTVGFESDGSTTSSFWIELPGVPPDSMAL